MIVDLIYRCLIKRHLCCQLVQIFRLGAAIKIDAKHRHHINLGFHACGDSTRKFAHVDRLIQLHAHKITQTAALSCTFASTHDR